MNDLMEQLKRLQSELNYHYNQLSNLEHNNILIEEELWFHAYILFMDKERSCNITLSGKEQTPKYVFEWDECPLFEILSNDTKKLGNLITHWVFHKLTPSKMKIQFPEIELGKLATYYENGEGIKGEFIESWNDIEVYYSEIYSEECKTIEENALRLINELRSISLDEKLRAGQALTSFILSRSRRHGLQENAPYIMINFQLDNQMVIHYYLNDKETSFENEAITVTSSFFNSKEKKIKSEVAYERKLKELVEILLKEEVK